jgi:inorganic pyrophosphatase
LIGEVAKKAKGDERKALRAAYEEVEGEEDEHLYHTRGWSRELWIEALGMPAVLPPPEEEKDVKSAIGAERAKNARETCFSEGAFSLGDFREKRAAHVTRGRSSMNKGAKASPHRRIRPTAQSPAGARSIVVVETPRGSRNKFKFDEQLGVFRLGSVLPAGSVFPFDFGYVPGTRGGDGDPIDVLLILDEPVFTGCLVRARLIGVLEAEQRENGRTERNDRLIAVACDAHAKIRSLSDLEERLLEEIEHFFVSYHEMRKTPFKVLGYKGAESRIGCWCTVQKRPSHGRS